MRGTKKKLFYYVVKKVIKRMKGIYVVKFNQVLELDLSKIELDGGACYALVGLFYKYVALKINEDPAIKDGMQFFSGYLDYFREGVDPYLQMSMMLQDEDDYPRDFTAPRGSGRRVYPDIFREFIGKEIIKPVYKEGGEVYSQVMGMSVTAEDAIANLESEKFSIYASMSLSCRIEKNSVVEYCYTQYFADPTYVTYKSDEDFYKAKHSLGGLLQGLIVDVPRAPEGEEHSKEVVMTVANIGLKIDSEVSHAICMLYHIGKGTIYIFDPNIGVIEFSNENFREDAMTVLYLMKKYLYKLKEGSGAEMTNTLIQVDYFKLSKMM